MKKQNSAGETASITLLAPLSGILVPIETVPDPVFARKIVGDGISLDPTSQILLAPCAGSVVNIHSSGHALTLQAEGGALEARRPEVRAWGNRRTASEACPSEGAARESGRGPGCAGHPRCARHRR